MAFRRMVSSLNLLERNGAIPLCHGFNVIRHAFDGGAGDQIALPDLPSDRAGAAHPNRYVRRLHGSQQVLERV